MIHVGNSNEAVRLQDLLVQVLPTNSQPPVQPSTSNTGLDQGNHNICFLKLTLLQIEYFRLP